VVISLIKKGRRKFEVGLQCGFLKMYHRSMALTTQPPATAHVTNAPTNNHPAHATHHRHMTARSHRAHFP
jgi:hypothetical protein